MNEIPQTKPAHYVDNKKFLEAITEFNIARKSDPEAPITNYLGKCLMDISHRIAYRPNFINYSYRDEMQEDALENCLRCIDRFDHENYSNPFGYFTRVSWFACITRIQKEQQQTEAKAGLVQSGMVYQDTIDHINSDDLEFFDPEAISSLGYLYQYEIKHRIKKPKLEKPRTDFDLSEFI